MCGIVGYIGRHQAAPFLIDGLSKLEYRGYDSSGIAVYHDGKIDVEKCVGRLDALRQKLIGHEPIDILAHVTHRIDFNLNGKFFHIRIFICNSTSSPYIGHFVRHFGTKRIVRSVIF